MMRSIVVSSLAAVALIGCGEARLLTGPAPGPAACGPAAITGRLIAEPDAGLALLGPDGRTVRIVWPFGYTARRELLRVILVSPQDADVARDGDVVELGGGGTTDGSVWTVCPSDAIRVLAPSQAWAHQVTLSVAD